MLKKLLKSTVVSLSVLSFASVMNAEVLKFAHVYEVEHPLHKGALMAAKEISKNTDGRIEVKVYPSSQLGKETALNEGLTLGTVDIIHTGNGFAGSTYGPISLTSFPFTLRGIEHWKNYRDSSLFTELSDGYAKATGGMAKIVALSYYGQRHVTSNMPILSPADMKGLKIRVPNAPAFVLFPKEVGANPTPMAFSEVYLALQQGVVDAQENPLPTIQAKKFYEVQSNINLTGHITDSILTVVSAYKFNKLSKKDQMVVTTALKNSAKWVTAQVLLSEQNLVSWFKDKGVKVNTVDRMPFIKAVAPGLTAGGLPFSTEIYNRLQKIEGN